MIIGENNYIDEGKKMKQSLKLMWSISEKPIDNDITRKIIIKKNNKIKKIRYLVLPIHRFDNNYRVIILDNNEYSIYRLLITIYNFYNKKQLSIEDLKNLNDNDVYDYINNAIIKRKENKRIYYIDIMGDNTFFEGLNIKEDKIGDIQYSISLGS